MNDAPTILLVEDNDDDVFFMKRVFERVEIRNPLYVVSDGQEAIDYLSGSREYADREAFPLPSLVLIDLKLPKVSGHEVLAWARSNPDFARIVFVVLTSSAQPSDIQAACRVGANAYVVKPASPNDLVQLIADIKAFWLTHNRFAGVSQ